MSAAKRGLVAALDCGTSLIKAGVFDLEGQMLGHGRCDAPCRFQPDGRVEQDPSVLEAGALEALREAVDRSGRDAAGVEAICVANQRATFLCIGRDETPICHAVSWLDGRGADEVAELRTRISDHEYYGITGIPNNPVFTLARLLWIRKNEPELWSSTRRFVLFMTTL